jgi:hypothetical protein
VADTSGERLFAAYLYQRGIPADRHPDIRGRHPDYLMHTGCGPIAAEVFEPTFYLPPGGGFFDSVGSLKAVFTGDKRKQTQAARDAGLPIVVVIGSDRAPLRFHEDSMTSVMFGP